MSNRPIDLLSKGELYIDGYKFVGTLTEITTFCDGMDQFTFNGVNVERVEPKDYKLISRSEIWDKLKNDGGITIIDLSYNNVYDADKITIEKVRKLVERDSVVFYEKVKEV